ncbi:autotransporter domain-containing protein [Mailhella sp.]
MFTRNEARRCGGAIYNTYSGQIKFLGTTEFSNNYASSGGGAIYNKSIYNYDSKIKFYEKSKNYFIGNTSNSSGGAIYNGETIDFAGSNTFDGNASKSSGGAIYNSGTINFEGTNTFTNNRSGATISKTGKDDKGNDIYIGVEGTGTPNDIYNSGTINILSGTTSIGGGITGSGTLNVQNGTLKLDADEGNTNLTVANKITLGTASSPGTIRVVDSGFLINSVTAIDGAIELENGAKLKSSKTIMVNAGNELDIAAVEPDGSVTPETSADLASSLKVIDGTLSVSGIKFLGENITTTNGGAILNYSQNSTSTTNISKSAFTGYTADTIGGAIANTGKMEIAASSFVGNTAAQAGGALYNEGTLSFAGINTFSGNTAGGTPNDIYNDGTINILSGGTVTMDGGITGTDTSKFNNAGRLEVKGGTVSGYTGDFTQTAGLTDIFAIDNYFGGKVDIQGGALVADYDTMMDEASDTARLTSDQLSKLSVADGANLTLNLIADDGLTDRTYNLSDYFKAKEALMSGDDGNLVFIHAMLQQAEGDSILLGQTGGSASADGLVFAAKGYQSYDEAVARVNGSDAPQKLDVAAGNMVILADAGSKAHTNSATSVSFGSDLTAKGMHVGAMKALTVKSGADLAFAATNADGLFLGADDKSVAVNVNVEEGASFKLGLAGDETAQKATLGDMTVDGVLSAGNGVAEASYTFGDVIVNEKGSAAFSKADVNVNGLSSSGTLSAEGGSVKAKSFTVSGGKTTLVNSTLDVPSLAISGGEAKLEGVSAPSLKDVTASGGKLELSETDLALDKLSISAGAVNVYDSELVIGELTAKGGTFFADPSTVIIKELSGNELGTAATIGADTAVVIGGSSIEEALQHDADAEKYMEGKASLVLGRHIKLTGAGGLLVDPNAKESDVPAAGSATFAPGSLLAADGHDFDSDEEPAIITGSGAGALKVSGDATLYISNARSNEVYTVAEGFSSYDVANSAWSQEAGTLILNGLVEGGIKAITHDDGTVEIVTTTAVKEDSDFFDAIPSNALHELAEAGGDVDAADTGLVPEGKKFLSRAVDPTFMPDEGLAIDAINEVSRAAVTAGVQNTSLRIADAASNTVVSHMSLSQHDASSAIHADGVDFWVAPMYGNLYTSGMVTSGSSVRGQFGGLALGADLEAGQFLGGKFRLGVAINGGGGQSETKGTATSTQNDYDFGGLNFYAGWNSGALNVIASVGYGFGNHEVEMGIPVAGVNKAKADIDTSAFTADLRAEYQFKTPYVDILPHAGIRYTALKTEAHDLKANGSVLNSVESDTQNIVQFPVGVTLSKNIDLAGWNVKPSADVSVIPAAGDKKATTKVNFSGLDAWDSVNTRVMDSTSWAGTIGVQAEKGNMTFGLNYGVQASSNETDQNIQVKFGWKF